MIIAGTGHRPNKLGGYSKEAFTKLVDLATDSLLELGPEKVISGMALGWDQALATAVLNLNIPLIAAVPFFGQESKWPLNSKKQYRDLISKADDVIFVCDKGYAPWKMQIRNEWMVDNCDLVLALWDGSEGGTGNCISYASSQGREILNLWSEYEDF